MIQSSLHPSDLLATLRYWRECGIDRLCGEGFQVLPQTMAAVVAVPSMSSTSPAELLVKPKPVSLDRLLTLPVSSAEKIPLMAEMATEVSRCSQCRLSLTRNQIVFGVGSLDAQVVFIGDTPKEPDEIAQEPFVGEARALLHDMIRAIRWQRQEVYITNVIKCRAPGDRPPKTDEMIQCQGFLFRQLEVIRPKVIVAMGKVAIECVLGHAGQVGQARGKMQSWRGVPVIATYHPAFCQRTPTCKRDMWEDLILLMKTLETSNQT